MKLWSQRRSNPCSHRSRSRQHDDERPADAAAGNVEEKRSAPGCEKKEKIDPLRGELGQMTDESEVDHK